MIRFFAGGDFVNGCEDHLELLQKWVNNMNLDLNLRYGEENAKNYKDLLVVLQRIEEQKSKSNCNFKDNFKNVNASCFWMKYFEKQENVEWVDFSLKLRAYIFETEKKVLSEPIIEKISSMVDEDGNKIVN